MYTEKELQSLRQKNQELSTADNNGDTVNFNNALDTFDSMLKWNEELMQRLINVTNRIKPIPAEPIRSHMPTANKEEANGIITELLTKIYRLRKYNEDYEIIVSHLENLI